MKEFKKVVIRQASTRLHRRADGSWVDDWKEAQQFGTTAEAINFCLSGELEFVQVLLKHPDDANLDVVVFQRQVGSSHAGESVGAHPVAAPTPSQNHSRQ